MFLVYFLLINFSFSNATYRFLMTWETKNPAFDASLYNNVLDPVECTRQLSYIKSDSSLRLQFLDAGSRIPQGITLGNTLDMGNYHGCLGIHQAFDDNTIQGKYCMINVPANQDIGIPEFPGLTNGTLVEEMFAGDILELKQNMTMNEELMDKVKLFRDMNAGKFDDMRSLFWASTSEIVFRLAVCIPKPCTVHEGLTGLSLDMRSVDLQFEEEYCRLPNDKPWAPADYVAIIIPLLLIGNLMFLYSFSVVFSVIGLFTILSTIYDLRNKFILQRDPKTVNPIYTSFSVYTNARRLTTFTKNPATLECVDGVRALSMAWIIILHTFRVLPPVINVTDVWDWQLSLRSIWVTSGYLAVDTFFLMSGMLLVYTSVGKLTSSKLIRSLHLFYLNRILRMFPLLAAGILLQASFFHWMSDGPLWQDMAFATEFCRNYWWINLLYVNNFFVPKCLVVSWYLAVDMQLHILSPILLYFVLSNSYKKAWTALIAGLLVTLTASTIYVFMKQLPGATIQPARADELNDYMNSYYFHSLPRAAPFFVGMLFGYILHVCRQKRKISKITVFLLWVLTITLGALSLYSLEPMKGLDHDNQTVDSLVNAFSRPSWAFAVASLIVLCVCGYGGPVNWFLSLTMWKLLSRISYAMFLLHYPFVLLINGSYTHPVHFSVFGAIYWFLSLFAISTIVGFVATVVIDAPFSTIFNKLLGGGIKKAKKEELPQNNNTIHT